MTCENTVFDLHLVLPTIEYEGWRYYETSYSEI